MAYLTTVKREKARLEYQLMVNKWAKALDVAEPTVHVRRRNGGIYRYRRRAMWLPPDASMDLVVHEFAHHLAHFLDGKRGHGPVFRIALVQVATVAYGRANRYTWKTEYPTVQAWARRHGLTV